MKYQRKPAVVEAFRFGADSEVTAPEWFLKEVQKENVFIDRCITDGAARVYGCTIHSKYGKARAKVGDYIIREPSGEIRLSKAEDFSKEYERI
ncbi:MAG: hypothetical protein Q4C77_02770 [Eubacteriales bacterium]|nr:hypothetical protein [Eubacteriales bacterium]